ncbi:MAG: 8-oxo-dGTP diphosphatase MutT [Gammaproteobacteria bacterium]|nr:8-oxo-dGTP diphosphatase MutT [Gammaproteobacteria bacterium]
MTPNIDVAAAVIVNAKNETLLSLRLPDAHQGGKWEFPGGKFEVGETPEQALVRELKEELDIDILQTEPFIELQYTYPEKTVNLHVLKVISFTGTPKGLEGQAVEWVAMKKLQKLKFPDANYPILEKLLTLFGSI